MTASVTPSFTKAIINHLTTLNIRIDDALYREITNYSAHKRLPMALQDKLWRVLEEQDNNGLGLKIGLAMEPQSYDMMGYLLLSSPSLGVAVDSLVNFSSLIGEGGHFDKSQTSEGWQVAYQEQFTTAVPLRVEAIFASIATGARWVADKDITPKTVYFRHQQQGTQAQYCKVFGDAKLLFEQSKNAIVFSNHDWHFKKREVNDAVVEQMLTLAKAQLATLQPQDLPSQVHALLKRQPWLTRVQLASSLGMSERSLTRKLSLANTSYKELAQDIKRNLALELIHNPNTTQASLAQYLGYSDESAFSKAFKRWTGMGFREYRSRHSTVS